MKKIESGKDAFNVIATGAIMFLLVITLLFVVNIPYQNTEKFTQKPIEHFQNYDDLVSYFEKAQSVNNNYYGRNVLDMISPVMSSGVAQKTSAESGASASTTYSKTNIQVEGVDEADIIKNDGKYIYAIAKGQLFIINAYPAEQMKIISTIDLNGSTPIELFISSDSEKLLVFTNEGSNYRYYGGAMPMTKMAYRPWHYGSGFVSAKLYNISNKKAPTLEKTIDIEGTYLNSRLIGNNAYFVVNSYPRIYYAMEKGIEYNDENSIIPLMRINGTESRIAKPQEIAILPDVRPDSFMTIASLNLETLELNKQTTTSSAQNLYASQNNLYLADQVWDYSVDKNTPIEILEIGSLVKSIYFPNWNTTEKTVVNKFHLENGTIFYGGQARVPGHILNQFSMDEYNNNFRIATTVGNVFAQPGTPEESRSNIYVIDKDMNVVGNLEGLAPGEKIYSVRFMGDKGYVVTFKKVDPLFVLDLSNPSNPRVLGKLKIPGYSDYLHPIDETHIIGIGKDTIESSYGTFAWYQGMKIAIFDVSNVENPKEMHKIVIGDRGTDSEALSDHRAFLFDKEKQLLVIPITLAEIPREAKDSRTPEQEKNSPTYGEQTFQGAMVFNVSLENGFVEKGRITHVSAEEELKRGYYYGYDSTIRRALYMDNTLFTFSDKMLKANNLNSMEEINSVLFPQNPNLGNNYYGYE